MALKKRIFFALILAFVFIFLAIAIFWFSPEQSHYVSTNYTSKGNPAGTLGSCTAFWLFRIFGVLAYCVPFIFFSLLLSCLFSKAFPFWHVGFVCNFLFLSAVLCTWTQHFCNFSWNANCSAGLGGILGSLVLENFALPVLGKIGSLIAFPGSLICQIFIHGFLLYRIPLIHKIFQLIFKLLRCLKKFILLFIPKKWIIQDKTENATYSDSSENSEKDEILKNESSKGNAQEQLAGSTALHPSTAALEIPDTIDSISQNDLWEPSLAPSNETTSSKKISSGDSRGETTPVGSENVTIFEEKNIDKTNIPLRQRDSHYCFPRIDLLEVSAKQTGNGEDCGMMMRQLVEILAQFGISVTPGEIHKGPVITRYEVVPAIGVRVEKIVSLDKNIAMGLAAKSVRIIAPVPGKNCVGIELSNKNSASVHLREILESKTWAEMKAAIPVVLGRGVTGEPMIYDLAKMPHLLIAGATGSGKTVCINAVIASLLYHASPEDLRFIMVDPKIVEMQNYNQLPHMLVPVVTDPKKVPSALKWLIAEMEHRYKIFARAGVRNIAHYNEKLPTLLSTEGGNEFRKFPYIVCIIDELADLMMVAPGDIEVAIARLAQLARAAGIHLILATQRPSVNVITGIIKANLPCRIAFKVSSKVDSRTILDSGGAEALLGQGDMLFSPPGASGLLRAQGALVSDEEINRIVDFLYQKNGGPKFEEAIQEQIENEDGSGEEGSNWEDELIPRALEIIRSNDRASTSFLQRKLKIGYNRAARIMDTLREQGLISELDES